MEEMDEWMEEIDWKDFYRGDKYNSQTRSKN
jgi:hypothetical protein